MLAFVAAATLAWFGHKYPELFFLAALLAAPKAACDSRGLAICLAALGGILLSLTFASEGAVSMAAYIVIAALYLPLLWRAAKAVPWVWEAVFAARGRALRDK